MQYWCRSGKVYKNAARVCRCMCYLDRLNNLRLGRGSRGRHLDPPEIDQQHILHREIDPWKFDIVLPCTFCIRLLRFDPSTYRWGKEILWQKRFLPGSSDPVPYKMCSHLFQFVWFCLNTILLRIWCTKFDHEQFDNVQHCNLCTQHLLFPLLRFHRTCPVRKIVYVHSNSTNLRTELQVEERTSIESTSRKKYEWGEKNT